MIETSKANLASITIQSTALIAAGLLGNYFNFPIFLNIDFIFGSIFAMLTLQFFGLRIGVLAAAVISSYTYILWYHPYAIIIMTAEVAVVGWLRHHHRIGMVLADTIYWILIGIPLVYLFYHIAMHIPLNSTFIVMVKQAVNGITNALAARLIFTGFAISRRSTLISYREIIYNLLAFFVLCPVLIILAVGSRTDFAETDHHLRTTLIQESRLINHYMETWVLNRASIINNLAGMAATISPEQMQSYLELAKKSDDNFLRIGLLDKEATIIAYFPLIDELGQKNIGKNFADRPFIPTLKQTLKPLISEVVMGRIGVPKPFTTMLSPVVVSGEYNGYVTGILSLDQIMQFLNNNTDENATLYTLIDKNGNVIMTNRADQQVMNHFVRGQGSLVQLDAQISQWVPVVPAHTSVTERWKQSSYVAECAIGSLAEWKLILEQPVAPFQKTLYKNYTDKLTLLFLLLITAMALAELLSRKSISTLEMLRLMTQDFSSRLLTINRKEITWPESGIMETNHLIMNFQQVADSLAAQFHELQQTQDALNLAYTEVEMQVCNRTAELDATNLALTAEIAERKQAAEVLRENEARLRAITDSAQDAIIMMDSNGCISFWNPAAERIFGYKSEEAIGQNLHQFIVPLHYHEAHNAAYPQFQRTGCGTAIGKTIDLEARRKDLIVISVQLSLSAVQMRDGWHAVGILRDITDRKRAEEELKEINRNLEEATARANSMAAQAEMASAAKSEFLANMSHEIRTPMNGVIGMTGLLLDTDLNDEQRHYAEIVRSSSESLLGIINDILDFSKIEAKKLDLEILDFNLSVLLNDFTSTLGAQARQKGLELHCIADPGVPVLLRGDPGRLRQVLTNLVGNAIKFSDHGNIAITVTSIENNEYNVLLRFTVQDTGIGIPENKLGLIFANFTQADASTTRRYGGTGLGLAISIQLAELMGGEMGVDSEFGKGSKFWFTARLGKQPDHADLISMQSADLHNVMPLIMEDQNTNSTSHSDRDIVNLFAGSKARILLAEDNITNQQVAMGILKKLGLRADAVANGAEVINALETLPYDLILMDIQMPVIDGIEATRRIRKIEANRAALLTGPYEHATAPPRIPIIAMTAHTIVSDRKKCIDAGMDDYVSKPVSPQELADRLKKWLLKNKDESECTEKELKKVQEAKVAETPVWDKQKMLERLMDDEELAKIIIDGFLADIPQQIQSLKDFLAAGDIQGIERQAHTIKGASANVGGERLRAVAYDVEKAARAENLTAAAAFMNELDVQFDRLKEAMLHDDNYAI